MPHGQFGMLENVEMLESVKNGRGMGARVSAFSMLFRRRGLSGDRPPWPMVSIKPMGMTLREPHRRREPLHAERRFPAPIPALPIAAITGSRDRGDHPFITNMPIESDNHVPVCDIVSNVGRPCGVACAEWHGHYMPMSPMSSMSPNLPARLLEGMDFQNRFCDIGTSD